MSPILILLASETATDPPAIDLPTPLDIASRVTTLAIDTHVTAMQIDGDLEVAFSGN